MIKRTYSTVKLNQWRGEMTFKYHPKEEIKLERKKDVKVYSYHSPLVFNLFIYKAEEWIS